MIQDLLASERVAANHWKPVLADDPNPPHRFQAEMDRLRAIVRQKELARLTDEEKALYMMKEQIAKENAAEAQRIEREEHLMQVPVSKTLDKLKAIREEIASDPSRKESELLRVDQTIAQWSEPNHNPATAEFMLQQVLGVENERYDAAESELNNRLFAIENERQALLAKRGRVPAPVVETKSTPNRVPIIGSTLAERAASLDEGFTNDPTHQGESMIRLIEAKVALKRGDSALLEALIEQYGEVATNE